MLVGVAGVGCRPSICGKSVTEGLRQRRYGRAGAGGGDVGEDRGGIFSAFDFSQASRLARLRFTADGGFLRRRIPESGGVLVLWCVELLSWNVSVSHPPLLSRTNLTLSPLALLCWYRSSRVRYVEEGGVAMVTWRGIHGFPDGQG